MNVKTSQSFLFVARISAALWLLVPHAFVHASPVVEQFDRMEINWSTHKIRFYGESGTAENLIKGVEGAEKRAIADGLSFIESRIHDYGVASFESLSTNLEKVTAEAANAAQNITKNVYAYNTLYFSDGTVRVYLESALPRALTTNLIRFRQKEAASTQLMSRSGILIRLDRPTMPRARYKIVDEAGLPLFDARDMAQEGYGKNLMGRWFEGPTDADVIEFVGKNHIELHASVDSNGALVIPRAKWHQAIDGHKALLVNGIIGLLLPPTSQPL